MGITSRGWFLTPTLMGTEPNACYFEFNGEAKAVCGNRAVHDRQVMPRDAGSYHQCDSCRDYIRKQIGLPKAEQAA